MNKKSKKPELLIPAGGLDTLKVAIDYGADAVYIGGQRFGLRAKADNFTIEEMCEACRYVHSKGKKIYLTVNIFAHNDDIEGIKDYFRELHKNGLDRGDTKIDALLISDPGIFMLAKEMLPDIDIHISTQANNTNYLIYKFWYEHGATRVVAARELSLNEIKTIRDNIPEDMEIEAFMHGAMCISYSGRCLLSSYFTGRDANKGACTHPCRWKYSVMEEKRPGEYLPVEEDERGTYIFNSKDLCMIEYIPDMIAAGIDSFKVEGRMKTALYVAAVTRTYRKAIDDYYTSEELYRSSMDYYVNNYTYIGCIEDIVENEGKKFIIIHQKNKFLTGDNLSVMEFTKDNIDVKVEGIFDEKMMPMESAPHPKQLLYIALDSYEGIKKGMIIRARRPEA